MHCKILVTGSNGQLGNELRALESLSDKISFRFTDIDDLDICDARQLTDLITQYNPDYIINCAGYTAVDKAEEDEEGAFSINAGAVQNIVNAIQNENCRLVHISTDYVLGGKAQQPLNEEAIPDPVSVYAQSKLKGEEIAMQLDNSIVFRTSWLYSRYGHNFVKTILRLSREREEINVVSDQVGTPTWAADLANTIISIILTSNEESENYHPGLFHFSNTGSCSWYDFALKIVQISGSSLKINPIPTEQYPLPAYRPPYSVLSKEKILKTYGISIPSWEESLEKCIKQIIL